MPLRTIFSKLAFVLLAVGILPLVGITVFAYLQAKRRMTEEVVTYFLEKSAADTADKINLMLLERDKDVRTWVNIPGISRALRSGPSAPLLRETEVLLNDLVEVKKVYDLLILADASGHVVATNTKDRSGAALDPEKLRRLRSHDVVGTPWFEAGRIGRFGKVDWHRSDLVQAVYDYSTADLSFSYNVGFSGPVFDLATGEFLGVWYNVMNWSFIQIQILDPVERYFEELGKYRSGYAYLWLDDANTVIGHKYRDPNKPKTQGNNYATRVDEDHHLPALRDAALRARPGETSSSRYGYPAGRFKISGLAATLDARHEGFGWYVGVGIDDEEIFKPVNDLRRVLVATTCLVAVGIIFSAYAISHRITGPVRRLSEFTEEIARGNLDARVEIESPDEIGVLAGSFNRMATDLKSSRERLIKVEKDAAWREMAAQVAHEIKNPLTPMKLATQHLIQTYRDGSPQFAEVLRRSTSTIIQQIDSLHRIATEFSDFARLPKRDMRLLDVNEIVRDVLALYPVDPGGALRVEAELQSHVGVVRADPDEIKRVFINLITNALQAMPDGGMLRVVSRASKIGEKEAVEIRVADTGIGMSTDVLHRLGEPYFSTKSGGTGLGLAISKNAVDALSGEIEVNSEIGKGTEVVVRLPAATPPAP